MNQEENKTAEKKKLIIIAAVALMILVGVTTTYAYIGLLGESKNQEISIDTGNIHLVFDDADSANINAKLDLGDSITKKFKIENKGTKPVNVQINWKDLINTYMKESLSYTLESSSSSNGPFTKVDTIIDNVPISTEAKEVPLSNVFTVPVQSTPIYYRVTITFNFLSDVNQNSDINAKLITKFSLSEEMSEGKKTLAIMNLKEKNGSPDFMTVATTDETRDGLYSMEDDYGDSYYFRGAVENNYVKFANYYWRIIRINGDGTLRMIYDGTSPHENGEYSEDRLIGRSAYNDVGYSESDDKYSGYALDNGGVGYMYGDFPVPQNCTQVTANGMTVVTGCESGGSTTYEQAHANINDSPIKTYIDTWYENNIISKGYSSAVSDTLFCNNRSINIEAHKQFYPLYGFTYPGDDKIGNGTGLTAYNSWLRLDSSLLGSVTPSIRCEQKHDTFTVSDTEHGNGDLTNPVALVTADEVVLAGGKRDSGDSSSNNQSYYLNKGNDYWSLSPYGFGYGTSISYVSSDGSIGNFVGKAHIFVSPVINLDAKYSRNLKGTGSMSDPYTVS